MTSRRTRKGFTLVELLVVVGVQFILVAATALLLTYTLSQCGRSTAAIGGIQQADAAMNDMAATVRNAASCATATKSGVTGLKCIMPANAVDTDGDGKVDTYYPTKFGADSKPVYAQGQRIWYYLGDATGAFGTTGTVLWRAIRTDDGNPTASDADKTWAYYYGIKSRFPLVASLSFSVVSLAASTTITLVASGANYSPDRYDATAAAKDLQTFTLSRNLLWRKQYE